MQTKKNSELLREEETTVTWGYGSCINAAIKNPIIEAHF